MITNERLKETYLAHFGIKGQKCGIRRYQNEDGSLTEEGKTRYNSLSDNEKKLYDSFTARSKKHKGTMQGNESAKYARKILEGKVNSKYKQGAMYENERKFIQNDKYYELYKSKEYTDKVKEANKFAREFGLDNYGGGGDKDYYDKETLRRAGDRMFNKQMDIDELSYKYYDKAVQHASKQMQKKYGDVALDSIKYYYDRNTLIAGGSMLALTAALLFTNHMMKSAGKKVFGK